MSMVTCNKCGRVYNGDVLAACPACKHSAGGAPVASPGRTTTIAASAPTANPVSDRHLFAQLAIVDYLRAGLALFLAVIVSTSFVTVGNQAEYNKAINCLGNSYCTESGGTLWYLVGGGLTILLVLLSAIFASTGASNRKMAAKS